jgi:hypothetical protein
MSLPFLPGTSSLLQPQVCVFLRYWLHQKTSFAKSQALSFRGGISAYEDHKPGIGGQPLPTQIIKKSQVYNRSRVPSQYLDGKSSLRFDSYFEEEVHNSRLEKIRVRRCVVFFHLEDGSITVWEPKQKNSALPQGIIIQRHRYLKEDGETYFDLDDLHLGNELFIYGKSIMLCDADVDTRVMK